ncbi:MAG: AbrB/MazE/SpoVT family DNA-binding domain-containing protein [Caulobacterales bacterium]
MASEHTRLDDIIRPYSTVSDRIRALDAAGVPRAEIARFLGKRYQHVRNVLESDAQRGGYTLGHADVSGVAESPTSFEPAIDYRAFVESRGGGAYRLVVRPDGSIVLPKEVVAAFKAEPGRGVMARLDGEEFKLISSETAMRRVRELVQRIIPADVDLVEQLLADRRAEAEREASGG